MKKIMIVIAAALFAAACAAPPTNRDASLSTNANATVEATPAESFTQNDAIAKEKQVWDALQNKNYEAFGNMLDADSIYVSSDAVYDKAGTVKSVSGFAPSDVTFSDWKFIPVDKDAVVVIYTIHLKGMSNGKPIPEQNLYASTAWVNRGGKWLAIFHQDTETQKVPPPPAPEKTQKATPSPAAASSPVVTTADVEANEKAVWATFKAKDYTTFESLLAPEFMEVEPYGITDKAESVKSVQTFDLSRAELSEWKTVKFDTDAALVTYTVKLPGGKPDTERHSTIWANKNGKWLGLFHQGTPVTPMTATPSPSTK